MQSFYKISQNSQENTSAGVSSDKKFAGVQLYLTRDSGKRQVLSCKFSKTFNNTFLTKHLKPTPPMPKFQPTPFFLPTPKFYGPTLSTPKPTTHATTLFSRLVSSLPAKMKILLILAKKLLKNRE